ncbi:MAG: LysR substrate-binding domain-containing protein [Pseudomonadota bacterium]
MQGLKQLIGSPSALLAFEAAGRLGSFTAASQELNVTQAAISFAVKQLEGALGVTLFARSHKKIELTEVGERFFHDVTVGLSHIRRSAEELHRRHRNRHVTLTVTTAFATYWMIPRLAAFRTAHPSVDLRFYTSDKDVDLGAEGIDLGVYRGSDSWPDYHAELLTPEAIYPVCSPAYAAAQTCGDVASVAGLNLIHLEEPFRPRPGWTDWFTANGTPWRDTGAGLRLNDYALVLHSALEGQGVALGWHHLVSDSIRRGRLVRPIEASLVTGSGFYVVWPKRAPLSSPAICVRDWLLGQAATIGGGC